MRQLTAVVFLLISANVFAAPKLELRGEFSQGGIIRGQTAPGTAIELDGKPVRVSEHGQFVFGFGRDHEQPAVLRATYPDGAVEKRRFEIQKRKYKIQRINGLPPSKVTPPKDRLDRISREAAIAKAARIRDDEREDFVVEFVWPAVGPISGVYGSQRILNGKPKQPHYGVDVAAATGTTVYAPAPGIVTMVQNDMYYSGGTMILDHGHGLSSSFLHLSKIVVKEGQKIQQGEKIAEIGATGRVTGAHLDWRMNWFKVRVDPELIVGPMPRSE